MHGSSRQSECLKRLRRQSGTGRCGRTVFIVTVLTFSILSSGVLAAGKTAQDPPAKPASGETKQSGSVSANPSKKPGTSGDGEQAPSPATSPDQQTAEQKPASPPQAEPSAQTEAIIGLANAKPITVEEINRRIEQVQASELDEESKAKIVNLYNEAVQQLQLAKQFDESGAEFDRAREQGPELLKALQEELAKPLEDPVIQPPEGATASELESILKNREAELEAARKTKADLEAERTSRAEKRTKIPEQLSEARKKLSALSDVAPIAANGETATPIDQAKSALEQSKKIALQSEIDKLERETRSYEARSDLLKARQDRAARQVIDLEKRVKAWQALVQSRRDAEAAAALKVARENVLNADPALKELAEENAELAKERKALSGEIATAISQTGALQQSGNQLSEKFDKIKKRVGYSGLTDAVGLQLRNLKATLPTIRSHQRTLEEISARQSAAQIAQLEVEDRRADLVDIEAALKKTIASVNQDLSSVDPAQVEEEARKLLQDQRDHLDQLYKDYESYSERLNDLDTKERAYLATLNEFTSYINKHVLWIQSAEHLGLKDVRKSGAALKWLVNTDNWRSAQASLVGTIRQHAALFAVFVILLAGLIVLRRRMSDYIVDIGALVSKQPTDQMMLTVRAILLTALAALLAPAFLLLPGWLLMSPPDTSEFSRAVGSGLYETSILLFLAQFIRHMCRTNGLAEKHFKWRKEATRTIRSSMLKLEAVAIPAFLVFFIFNAQSNAAHQESLGRIAFSIAFVASGVIVYRMIRPMSGVLDQVFKSRQSGGWWYQVQRMLAFLAGAAPMILVVTALVGWFYTSIRLGNLLIQTAAVLIGLVFANSLIQRWLLFQMQRRAVREAMEKKAATGTSDAKTVTGEDGTTLKLSGPKVQISDINTQTKRLLRAGMTIAVVLAVWTIWSEVVPALNVLREVELWNNVVESYTTTIGPDGGVKPATTTDVVPVTLIDLILALLTFTLTLIAGRNFPGLLEITILDRLPLQPSARYAMATVTRYVITTAGVVLSFRMIGIGWSQVQWLVAAMTVGLGFGLQEIFANFVSGLILLFEQPIRVGDIVTVGNTSGVVSRIRIRATTITDWEQKELIVPNKRFITGEVLNWTLSDSIIRLSFPIEVARTADPDTVKQMLNQVSQDIPTVLPEPESFIVFLGFGNNSLKFELRAYTRREDILATLNDTNSLIDKRMREKGIDISIPRQETILRSAIPAENPYLESSRRKEHEEATI